MYVVYLRKSSYFSDSIFNQWCSHATVEVNINSTITCNMSYFNYFTEGSFGILHMLFKNLSLSVDWIS